MFKHSKYWFGLKKSGIVLWIADKYRYGIGYETHNEKIPFILYGYKKHRLYVYLNIYRLLIIITADHYPIKCWDNKQTQQTA